MSSTRFVRTGRCRFLICLAILVLMVGMVAIFHRSQVQLDETREQRLHCEQQQEALNERLTTLVEQKYHLERNQERERGEHLESQRNLEQKLKELQDKYQKEQVEQQMRFDKLKQTHTILQSDHKHLKEETQKTNKQQLENINGLEKKLQSIKSELQKEKSNKSGELIEWREKYNIAENDYKRLTADNQQLHAQIKICEQTVQDYQSHCEYKAVDISRKPVAPKPDISIPSTSEKSFKHQDSIVPKTIKHIADDEQQQQEKPNRQISVENNKNHQVAPLSAPKNNGQLVSSSAITKSEQQMLAATVVNATSGNIRSVRGSSTISSNSPPLALPPNQRKLPENVAPIPDNFEDLLQKSNNENPKTNDDPSPLDENHNHNLKDKPAKSVVNNNYDSGAHGVKNILAEGDSNIAQHDDDINNFFDNDQDLKEHNKNKDINDDKEDDVGNDDDDGGADNDGAGSILGGAAAGDIAVKHNQQQQLLDESLRNEIADDQGKEFGDGLRLDEGAMEDDDDDDYSNRSARKQAGGQAIRN